MYFLSRIIDKLEFYLEPANASAPRDIELFFENGINILLQKAILSGEYYEYDVREKINAVLQLLERFRSTQPADTTEGELNAIEEIEQTSADDPNKELIEKISLAVQNYLEPFSELAEDVQKNLEALHTNKHRTIVDLSSFRIYSTIKHLAGVFKLDENIRTTINTDITFDVNVFLAYLDEFLECEISIEHTLKHIINHLDSKIAVDEEASEIVSILRDKAEYLQFKIEQRRFATDPKLQKPQEISPGNCFYSFYKKSLDHYNVDLINIDKKHLDSIEASLANPIDQIILEPYHHLNRYYDKAPFFSLEKRKLAIEKLITSLENKFHSSTQPRLFNLIAIITVRNLLSNTYQKLTFLEKVNSEYKELTDDIHNFIAAKSSSLNIEIIQKGFLAAKNFGGVSLVADYYCHQIFVRFINGFLEKLIEHPEYVVDSSRETIDSKALRERLRKIRSVIEYLKSTFEDSVRMLKAQLSKLESHKTKPVSLMFDECFIPYHWKHRSSETETEDADPNDQQRLFLDSSYVLPNDFNLLNNQVRNWELTFKNNLITLQSILEVELNKSYLRFKIDDFDKKTKENDFRIVTIVALFVSIITFVLINVKIFDGRTGLESFAIMIGLAACFFIFVLLFYIIVADQLRKYRHSKFFWLKLGLYLLIPGIFALISYSILTRSDYNTNRQIKETNVKMDSLNRVWQKKLDSVSGKG